MPAFGASTARARRSDSRSTASRSVSSLPSSSSRRNPSRSNAPSGANGGRPARDGTPADASGCPAGHLPLRLETVRRVPLSRALLAIRRRCHKPRTAATSTACGRHCVRQVSPSAGTTRDGHRERGSDLENGPAGASAPGRRGSFGPSGNSNLLPETVMCPTSFDPPNPAPLDFNTDRTVRGVPNQAFPPDSNIDNASPISKIGPCRTGHGRSFAYWQGCTFRTNNRSWSAGACSGSWRVRSLPGRPSRVFASTPMCATTIRRPRLRRLRRSPAYLRCFRPRSGHWSRNRKPVTGHRSDPSLRVSGRSRFPR